MIKINLASRKESGIVGHSKAGGFTGINFKMGKMSLNDLKAMKDLPFRKVLIPLAVSIVAYFVADTYKTTQVEELDALLAKQKEENSKLEAQVVKFKTYDGIKKQLDEDEVSIKAKLDTIKKLTADRPYLTQFIQFVSKTIPSDVWLTSLTLEKSEFSFKGSSVGYYSVSDFMKNLTESTSLKDVSLKNSEARTSSNPSQPSGAATGGGIGTGGDITNFEILAKRR